MSVGGGGATGLEHQVLPESGYVMLFHHVEDRVDDFLFLLPVERFVLLQLGGEIVVFGDGQ